MAQLSREAMDASFLVVLEVRLYGTSNNMNQWILSLPIAGVLELIQVEVLSISNYCVILLDNNSVIVLCDQIIPTSFVSAVQFLTEEFQMGKPSLYFIKTQ